MTIPTRKNSNINPNNRISVDREKYSLNISFIISRYYNKLNTPTLNLKGFA